MRIVLLGIVMLFPLVDLFVTARFARWSGASKHSRGEGRLPRPGD